VQRRLAAQSLVSAVGVWLAVEDLRGRDDDLSQEDALDWVLTVLARQLAEGI
jgi:hypothetical protein